MENLLRAFFEEHVLPLSKKVQNNELAYFNVDFDSKKESYFASPAHSEYLNFTNIPLDNKEGLERYLNEFWKNTPELLRMIPDLTNVAFELKQVNREQSTELSPFIYTMF